MAKEVNILGNAFLIDPSRAVFCANANAVFVADIHLGKSDFMRNYGIAVPYAVQIEDIKRIQGLLTRYRPQKLVILGDFLHGKFIHEVTLEQWNLLKNNFSEVEFVLIEGNHDKHFDAGLIAMDKVESTLGFGNFICSHEPLAHMPEGFDLNIHGHIHPAFRLRGMRQKLPALVWHPPYLKMPAFSQFTAGVEDTRGAQKAWVFLEQEQQVIPVVG